jgi:hypothetical protein
VQLESTGSALLIAAQLFVPALTAGLHKVETYGSFNLVGPGAGALALLSGVLPLLGVLAIYARLSWRARAASPEQAAREAVAAVLASLVAFMVLGKVFSPQYVVWLLPLGVFASAGSRRLSSLLFGACVLTQVIYPYAYSALAELSPWMGLLVLLRNGLLLGWALLL